MNGLRDYHIHASSKCYLRRKILPFVNEQNISERGITFLYSVLVLFSEPTFSFANGIQNKPGPAQVVYPRLKNSRKTSKCQVLSFTVLENRKFHEKKFSKKLHTQKNGQSGAPGPASANPWRAERGHFRNCQHFSHS